MNQKVPESGGTVRVRALLMIKENVKNIIGNLVEAKCKRSAHRRAVFVHNFVYIFCGSYIHFNTSHSF